MLIRPAPAFFLRSEAYNILRYYVNKCTSSQANEFSWQTPEKEVTSYKITLKAKNGYKIIYDNAS